MCVESDDISGQDIVPGECRIKDLRLGSEERLVLDVFRCFCLDFADARSKGWVMAFSLAENVLGAERGPNIAHLTANVLLCLRSERERPFNFVDPRCEQCRERVLPTELAFIDFLRAALTANRAGMLAAGSILAEGRQATETTSAMLRLADCMMTRLHAANLHHGEHILH